MAEAGALVWLAGFGLGAAVGGAVGGPVAAMLPRLEGEPSPIFVMVGLAAVTALAGAVTFGLFAASGGGLAESIRFVKAEKAVAGFCFLRQFAVVGVLLSIFVLYYLSYLRRVRLLVIPNWWSLAIVLCFIVNAFGIYAWGQRYSVAMSAVGMIAGYHYFVARLSVTRLGLLATGMLAIFLGLRVARDVLLFPEGVISQLEGVNIWRQIAISMHGSQLDALLLVMRDFDLSAGLRWGEDFAAGIAALVPRAIWPDPPVSALGAWFRQIYEPETVNGWPITLVGEWLVNFGWTGVALGGAASGYVLRAARDAYDDMWRNPWSLMMSIVVGLFVFPGGINVGSPQTYVLVVIPMVLIVLALRLFAPMRGRWA